jgi:hypothetical protein
VQGVNQWGAPCASQKETTKKLESRIQRCYKEEVKEEGSFRGNWDGKIKAIYPLQSTHMTGKEVGKGKK